VRGRQEAEGGRERERANTATTGQGARPNQLQRKTFELRVVTRQVRVIWDFAPAELSPRRPSHTSLRATTARNGQAAAPSQSNKKQHHSCRAGQDDVTNLMRLGTTLDIFHGICVLFLCACTVFHDLLICHPRLRLFLCAVAVAVQLGREVLHDGDPRTLHGHQLVARDKVEEEAGLDGVHELDRGAGRVVRDRLLLDRRGRARRGDRPRLAGGGGVGRKLLIYNNLI